MYVISGTYDFYKILRKISSLRPTKCMNCIIVNTCLSASTEAGLPFNSSAGLDVSWSESELSTEVALHSGFKYLKIALQREVFSSSQSTGHLLVCIH